MYEGTYGAVAKSDMLKMLVWDCYSWAAWQFFKVKDRKGNYREIPGSRSHYAGFFPLWRLSYAIIPYIRMKFEKCGLGFQNLYNMPKGVEVPWLTYQQFGNLVGNLMDMIVEEENRQPMIDAAGEMRSPEDYDDKFRTVKNDFLRTWHHSRSAKPISLLPNDGCSRSRRTGWRNLIGYSSVFMRIWWVANSLKLGSKCSQTITKRNRTN